MKSFLEKSKRALVLLLTGAMIATSVPSTAFAATVADDDVIIEEAVDAVAEDAVVEEEIVAEPSDVDEALGADEDEVFDEEAVDSADAVPADEQGDNNDRTLTIAWSEGAAIGSASGNLGNLVNGTPISNSVFKVTYAAQGIPAGTPYESVTWSFMKRKDRTTDSSVKSNYADDKLEDATADLTKLGLSWTGNKDTFTIVGTPNKYAAAVEYVVVATDSKNTDNRDFVKFNIGVAAANVAISSSETSTNSDRGLVAHATPTYSLAGETNGTVNFADAAVFMNYTVEATKPAGSDKDNVAPFKIVLDGSNIDSSGKLSADNGNELSYVVSTTTSEAGECDDFVVTADKTELYKNNNVTLTITPDTKLFDANNAHGTSYDRFLIIKSKAFSADKIVGLRMTVKSDLDVTVKEDTSVKTVTTVSANDAGTITLTNVKVGEEIKPITFTFTGGHGDLTLSSDYASNKVNGLTLSKVDLTPLTATYTLSGTIDAQAMATKTFNLIATDEKNNHYTLATTINVVSADVDMYADTDKMTFTAGTGLDNGYDVSSYSWGAPSDYTASDANSYKAVITLKNNGKKDIKVTPTLTGTSTMKLGSTADVTVPKNGEAKIEIIPGATSDTGVLQLVADPASISPRRIALTFTKAASGTDIEINQPATLSDAKLGQSYNATFKAVKSKTAGPVEWTIVDADTAIKNYKLTHPTTTTGWNGTTNEMDGTELEGLTDDDSSDGTDLTTSATALSTTYALSLDKTSGVLSGAPKAVTPSTLVLCIQAKTTTSAGAKYAFKVLTLDITKPAVTEALTLSSGTTVLSKVDPISTVVIPDAKKDATEGKTATITVKNNTAASLTGVHFVLDGDVKKLNKKGEEAALSAVDSGVANNALNSFFTIVYDENTTLDTTAQTNGITLTKSGDSNGQKDIVVKTGIPSAVAAVKAGTYVAMFKTDAPAGSNLDVTTPYKFKVTFTVTDAPKITARVHVGTSNATSFAAGTTYAESDVIGFTAELEGDPTMQFDLAWADNTAKADPDHLLKDSGLEMTKKGLIKTTSDKGALKAGTYKVIITATSKDGSVSGSLEHEFVITATNTFATINAEKSDDASAITIAANDILVLPGCVVGDESVRKNKISFEVKTSGLAATEAKNVLVKVEDADDDRNAADIETSGSKTNRYLGSSDVIGVDGGKSSSLGNIPSGKGDFYLTSLSTATSGTYKVKITLYGDNVTPKSFYAVMLVVDKLEITTTELKNAKVGETYIETINAVGPKTSQDVVWSEAGTKETADAATSTFYITGTPGTQGSAGGTTGLKFYGPARAANATTDNGLVAKIGNGTLTGEATPAKAYENGAKINVVASIGTGQTISAYNVTNNPAGIVGVSGAKNNGAWATPTQEAKKELTLTIAKSDDLKISRVRSEKSYTVDSDATTSATRSLFKGTPLGTGWRLLTGYTNIPVIAGYTNTDSKTEITISNPTSAGIPVKAKLEGGENSKFTIAWGDASATTTAKTIAAAGTQTLVITPNTKLAKGTYTDKVIIYGDNSTDLTFDITFTVEDASYLLSVGYEWNTDETVFVLAKDAVVKNSGTALKAIKLNDATKNPAGGPAADGEKTSVIISNTGNSTITNIVVREVDANGAVVDESSENAKFVIANGARPETNAGTSEDNVGALTASLDAGKQGNIFIKPANVKDANDFSGFVEVSYKEGSDGARKSIKIPVDYTVVDNALNVGSVSPDPKVVIDSKAEGYDPNTIKKEVTLSNTARSGGFNTIKSLSITITGDDAASFKLESNDINAEVNAAGTLITIDKLPASTSSVFNVKPVKELAEGKYEATLTITGGNLQAPITRPVEFEVSAATTFEANIKKTAKHYDDYADRLWNTVVDGLLSGISPTAGDKTANGLTLDKVTLSSATEDVTILADIDGQTGNDIKCVFTVDKGSDASLSKATAKKVTIEILNTSTVKAASVPVKLSAAQKTAAGGASGTEKYFTSMTFKFYADAKFDAFYHGAYIAEKVAVLAGDNIEITEDSTGIRDLTATIPIGGTLGSAFSSGKLPTTTKEGETFGGWVVNGGTEVINPDTPIYADTTFYHTKHDHKYASASDKNEDHVKWIWTGNETDGYTDAELHLYCVEASCPSEDKGEIIIYTDGTRNVNYTTPTSITITDNNEKANCEKGARLEFKATATVHGVTYTSTKSMTPGTALGHKYGDAVITWTQDPKTNAWSVKVTKTCSVCDADMDNHTIELTVNMSEDKTTYAPKCTEAGKVVYTLVSYTDEKGNTITDIPADKKAKETVVPEKGHNPEATFDFTNVDLDKLTANAVVTCPDDNFELYNGPVTLKLDAEGNYNTSITGKDGKTYKGVYTPHEHKWVATWTPWARTDANDKFSWATELTLTCTEGTKPEVRKPEVKITSVKDGEEFIDYTATAVFDGNTYTNPETFTVDSVTGEETSKHEHKWKAPVWTWDPADEGVPTSAKATFTCSVGNESKTVDATITSEKDGDKYIDYTAKVTFEKKDYTDVITIDAETGKRTSKHEHKWGTPSWTWTAKDDVTATFTCTVGKEPKSFPATVTVAKGPNSKGNTQYKATVTGPDEMTYSDLKWFDASGNPTSGEGIGIELAETEYPYTGAKIIPVFTVVDYALDKVLAEKTDYTVKYTNNVNVGTATITVTGKGNYGVKNVTITESFTITDPMDGEDTTDYAGSIKSVKASKDGYTYDGTAKYPKTLTIKTKNDGEITATYDGTDGYTLNDGAKEVMIVVTNNINKGSGTVAVTGADKKTKKTTFPIKAADLSTASTEDLTINVDPAIYAVKGAIPAVEVSYKGLDLTEGADYTVKYKNNKAVGAATATITGKGNFAKSATPVSFEVTPFEITKVDNVAVYAGVAGKGVKVTMYDAQGNVIPAKKNYTVKVEKGDTDITTDKTKLQAGEEIKVTVTAAAGGNLEPDSSADIDITVAPNLAKIKVNVPKTFTKTFTGEAIELDEEDFESGKIAVGSLKYGEDFEIIGYQNNVKKGKMTVYIQGISENASGTGKFKVTIAPQTMKKAD